MMPIRPDPNPKHWFLDEGKQGIYWRWVQDTWCTYWYRTQAIAEGREREERRQQLILEGLSMIRMEGLGGHWGYYVAPHSHAPTQLRIQWGWWEEVDVEQLHPKQRQECTLRTALKVATVQITSRQSAKLFSSRSSRRNWDSPNPSPAGETAPSPAGECAPSPWFRGGGGAHSLAREGLGESQFRRGNIQYTVVRYSLYICTLGCTWCTYRYRGTVYVKRYKKLQTSYCNLIGFILCREFV